MHDRGPEALAVESIRELTMNILHFAEATENSGIDFYQDMALNAANDGTKRVFTELAQDEQEQLKRLHAMLDRFPELAGLDSQRLDELPNVFEQRRKALNHHRPASDLEAYQLARDTEREIVRHYFAAAEQEQDPAVKRMLNWIAALERFELNEIEQLYDFANAPTDSLEWGEFSNLDEFHNFGRYEDLRQGELGDPVIPDTILH
jgi:rubrerythrin